MKQFATWWLVVAFILVVPHALVFVAGVVWLYQQGWLWYWMVGSAVATAGGWLAAKGLQGRRLRPQAFRAEPPCDWPPARHAVWGQVEAIARRVEAEDLPLDRAEPAWQVLREVLSTVATHYHPTARQPELQIPAPHVLKIIELVAADLRQTLSENVPGAHVLRLSDLQNLKRLYDWAGNIYVAYRVASFAYDPVAALLRELRELAGSGLSTTSAGEIKRWAVGYFVRRSGYYAIRLYSGELVLDEVAFDSYTTGESEKDARRDAQQGERLGEEPLRVLVLGQVKAGKSSLLNALFGECKAAADVVPRTRGVQPYVLEREAVERAIILDTAGYDAAEATDDPFDQFRGQIPTTDLVLMACSATSAARGVDRRLLDRLQAHYQAHPDRTTPPVVVALTHIDQLRPFSEWNPPYNLGRAKRGKAAEIRRAAQAVAEDLGLSEELVIPVCLRPGDEYNVEEALIPTLVKVLPRAEAVKVQRCLRAFRRRETWQQLWQQAVNSGRILLGRGRS